MSRVRVFIDYQNVFHGAQDAFFDPALGRPHPTDGHVYPLALAEHLVDLGKSHDADRVLDHVTVYKGMPTEKSHPKAQSASARQKATWQTQSKVTATTRPLRYQADGYVNGRPKWKAGEKGIDVLLALDLAIGARDSLFDVGIVVSADTDLVPAMEVAMKAGVKVESAVWSGPYGRSRGLHHSCSGTWTHTLDQGAFAKVKDTTDYTIA